MFRKPIAEVGRSDIEALIARGAEEDRTLEFKRALATRDGSPDAWMSSQDRIGNPAKKDLTKELIAFANTAGGTLILGVDEDGDRRASAICSIPKCRELADRLGASITISVDPPLTSLETAGVEIDGQNGVVIFRVPASHNAPHRDKDDRESYSRIGDKSVPMTMRQVQDLAVNISRGAEQTVKTLEKRSSDFSIAQPQGEFTLVEGVGQIPNRIAGFRAAALPLERMHIEGMTDNRSFRFTLPRITRVNPPPGAQVLFCETMHNEWKPMLRGIRSFERTSPWENLTQIVQASGLIEISRKTQQTTREALGWAGVGVHARFAYYVFAHLLIRVEAIRTILGRPELEFALDFEWVFEHGTRMLFPSPDGYGNGQVGSPIEPRNRVADYEMPSRDSLSTLWNTIQDDLNHSFGFDRVPRIDLDFGAAIDSCVAAARGA